MSATPVTQAVAPTFDSLLGQVQEIGRSVARQHADDVDRKSRFPRETIDALKKARVLSAGIPQALGGSGCNIRELSQLVTALSEHCASSGMVLAMHLIKLETFTYHGRHVPEVRDYLSSVSRDQRLVASVTSEVGVGGDLRTSIAAVQRDGDRFTLVKNSSCLSYGAESDDLLITCRRTPESAPSDQVIVLAPRGTFTLEQRGEWDAMGLRGTCSPPFLVSVEGAMWQVYERPFGEIAARTMVPDTHILWSSVWLGIATDAVARARTCISKWAHKDPDTIPPAAQRLARIDAKLQTMRATISAVTNEYHSAHRVDDTEFLTSVAFSLRILNLKVLASEMVVEIATGALGAIGFQGYLHQSPFCVARHIRDAHSAALMISNERVLNTTSSLQLVHRGD